MNKHLLFLAGLLLAGSGMQASVCAQVLPIVPVISLVNMIAAQNAANKAMTEKTTTATYRGQNFLLKRTPEAILTEEATDRIAQLEAQLALCRTALLADSASPTCPTERQPTIRAAIKYINLARPNWAKRLIAKSSSCTWLRINAAG